MEVKKFKDDLVDMFQNSRKTTYGKNELIMFIKDFYTSYLENKNEDNFKSKTPPEVKL